MMKIVQKNIFESQAGPVTVDCYENIFIKYN